MADFGVIESYLAGLESSKDRRVFNAIFKYFLKALRFGHADPGEPAENFAAGFFKGTTAGTANTEFSIPHTFGSKPYLLIPVLPLDVIGAKIVDLTITRAADANRVYLKSSVTNAPIYFYLEG